MIEKVERSLFVIVSAPSGAGKTTLCNRLLAKRSDLAYSVSCTTRAPREGEVDGEDYIFIDESRFKKRVEKGDFLEYAQVHGAWYGTLRSTVADSLRAGMDIILDIDVQGAGLIRERISSLPSDNVLRRGYVDIFIAPPSVEELRARLEGRAKDSPDVIERRMRQAEKEVAESTAYRYLVVNDDLERAERALDSILEAEHHRVTGGMDL